MLRCEHLCKSYAQSGSAPGVDALQDVSLHIRPGEYAAIIGPSGSGKSTLMNILGCLDRADSGTYHLHGRDVSQLQGAALSRVRGEEIGFVFQGFQLLPRLTAEENVALPLLLCGVPERERLTRARALLAQVGLEHRLRHHPAQLSGGQQQRVAVARALVRSPAVLLADEPTGNLDAEATGEVLALLEELHHAGRTVVVITHDAAVAARAERRICIAEGRIRELSQNEGESVTCPLPPR